MEKQLNIPLPISAYQKAFEMKSKGEVAHRDDALVMMMRQAIRDTKKLALFEPSDEVRKNSVVFVPKELHDKVMDICGKKSAYDRGTFPLKKAYEFLLTKGAELV